MDPKYYVYANLERPTSLEEMDQYLVRNKVVDQSKLGVFRLWMHWGILFLHALSYQHTLLVLSDIGIGQRRRI